MPMHDPLDQILDRRTPLRQNGTDTTDTGILRMIRVQKAEHRLIFTILVCRRLMHTRCDLNSILLDESFVRELQMLLLVELLLYRYCHGNNKHMLHATSFSSPGHNLTRTHPFEDCSVGRRVLVILLILLGTRMTLNKETLR